MLVVNVNRRWSASSLPRSQVSDLYSSLGSFFACLMRRGYHRPGVLIGHLRQHHVTGMTFDQGRDIAVLRPGQQIAFPMARHRPIINRCRSLTDRDGILDLSPSIAMETRLFRSTDRALRSKMAKQLFLEHAAGLDKQAAIDGLV